jgi:hypothetical protein
MRGQNYYQDLGYWKRGTEDGIDYWEDIGMRTWEGKEYKYRNGRTEEEYSMYKQYNI